MVSQVAVADIETRQLMNGTLESVVMALGTCQFYETMYALSPADTVIDLGNALSELYGSIIIFCVKAGSFFQTNKLRKNPLNV